MLPRAFLSLVLLAPASAFANDGPLLIDHLVKYDDSGIWKRSNQTGLAAGAAVAVIGGAMFVDSDSRLGRTFDQALDSMAFTAGTTTLMKYGFSRERPSENPDPNSFFSGKGHQSFPSGEVAEITAVVTPFIAEYGGDHPWVYGLALLPAYDAVARVKVHGHWQSDVLVGAGIGAAFGVYAHHRKTPFIAGVLPGGGFIFGYRKSF
ncbi:MAG TPA: phosphatase PAP2 family protein [Arenimonas sp.]|uniref:phosphatase PAP2 family protein n=1 Tax=Arenimonas sp. TaxID=1872635 RepID=UPI002C8712B4|nr:phosphatase PAP2 family protein [Arenimonas sp.]HMB57875.1 phosphatase PAP2 family protein [Arenimonas sp.]